MNVKDYTNSKDPQVIARRKTLDELSDLDQELFKMSDDLKNCPFCDGEAKLDHNGDYSWAYCTKCDAMTQPEISEDDARDKWNLRVEDWISVDEEMPEHDETVIIRGGCGYYDSRTNIWYSAISKNHLGHNAPIQWTVTHWMPLPEPPK